MRKVRFPIDRPKNWKEDIGYWKLEDALVPPVEFKNSYSPVAPTLPAGQWVLLRGLNNEPLEPPMCWSRPTSAGGPQQVVHPDV